VRIGGVLVLAGVVALAYVPLFVGGPSRTGGIFQQPPFFAPKVCFPSPEAAGAARLQNMLVRQHRIHPQRLWTASAVCPSEQHTLRQQGSDTAASKGGVGGVQLHTPADAAHP
jgi:hypothetical protein